MSNLEKIKKLKAELRKSKRSTRNYQLSCIELIRIINEREWNRHLENGSCDYAHGM